MKEITQTIEAYRSAQDAIAKLAEEMKNSDKPDRFKYDYYVALTAATLAVSDLSVDNFANQ